jgi:hypothetical protein
MAQSLLNGTDIDFNKTPLPLMLHGMNISALVSTASIYQSPNNPQPVKTTQIIAHFDTGATRTSIDVELAKQLNLIPTGQSPSYTAAGLRQATNYVIDLSFPSSTLRPYKNLQISSCVLQRPNKPLPFKLLIGRDVMSHWNIVWDGPTSTVIISD